MYFTTVSGYALGTIPVLFIFGACLIGGLFMASVANTLLQIRTLYEHDLQKWTWVTTVIIYAIVNLVLLALPAQPYGHWAVALIYMIIVWNGIRLNVLDPECSVLNESAGGRGVAYLLGFIPIAIPMWYLSSSISTHQLVEWQAWVSGGICVAMLIVVVLRIYITNCDYNRRFVR